MMDVNQTSLQFLQQMIKNGHSRTFRPQAQNQSHHIPLDFYMQSFTQPLKIASLSMHQQQKNQKQDKRRNHQGKNKRSHQIYIKIVQEDSIKPPPKHRPKHKKGKSMDLQIINEFDNSFNPINWKDLPQKNKKIIINSNFLQQMRKRNANTEMKNYNNFASKTSKAEDKNEIKKPKAKKSNELLNPMKKYQRHIIQLSSGYGTSAHLKKKNSKNIMKTNAQHSLTFSTKLSKQQQKSLQFLQERRCKSSLKQKKNSKVIVDLKTTGNELPIPSKLNSLYSNTTSLYSSHNDLSLIEKKLAFRIPTQQATEQIQEIRRYESLILHSENTVRSLRNLKYQSLIKNCEPHMVQPQIVKTQDIISTFLQKFETESQVEIVQPRTLDKINEMYNQSSMNRFQQKKQSKQSSLIEKLEDVSIDQHMKIGQDTESAKLNEIIAIIEKGGNTLVQKSADKQYVIKVIKEILQNKKKQEQPKQILTLQKYQPKQPKTKTYLDSNSLNASSLSSSVISQTDISVLNLQILDKALREREQYLEGQLKRQIQKIEEQQQQNGTSENDKAHQIERLTKWVNHQIKQVHHTRTQLWKGFNVAKSLLKDQLSEKNREMMKCLSQKYIRHGHSHKPKKEKYEQKCNQSPQSNLPELKGDEWSQLNNAMLEGISPKALEDESNSPIAFSPLVQHNPLHLEDLRFLTSNDSNQFLQSQGDSVEQQYDDPDKLDIELKIIEENSSQIDERSLKRQQSNCESPRSQSGSQSYGAIIIEREDTFLFSSQKKETDKYLELTIDDKEDICEFLFLDLCIEIKDELDKQSKIIRSLKRFINTMKEQSKRQRGFKTNSAAIKEYLTTFISFLKGKPELIMQIHKTLDKPMGPTALQILKYMHTFNEQIEEDCDNYILTAKIFDSFEESYMKALRIQKYYDDEQRQAKRRFFIKNAIHIHNKAIYDAYNEALDKDRPFGAWGEPFAWKKVPKFSHVRDSKIKNDILLKRAQQTIEYSNYLCGFMVDKQDCLLKDNPAVTDAYIEQIRYDRLSHMMAKQLEESEQRMQFFDDQETQILVDMAQGIFLRIVLELSQELALIL